VGSEGDILSENSDNVALIICNSLAINGASNITITVVYRFDLDDSVIASIKANSTNCNGLSNKGAKAGGRFENAQGDLLG
jgi:hypothetical protein